MCVFTWNGCAESSLIMPTVDEYPTIKLSEITDDVIDAYYYLGQDKIGCMDRSASNYLDSAVLDDGSCMYLSSSSQIIEDKIKIYPQPATTSVIIEFISDKNLNNRKFFIHNLLGEKVYTGSVTIESSININVHDWTSGIYYIVIKMENRNLTHRFVVE